MSIIRSVIENYEPSDPRSTRTKIMLSEIVAQIAELKVMIADIVNRSRDEGVTAAKIERERCIRAICHVCREGDEPERVQEGVYIHRAGGQGPCLASAIRALGEEVK